MSNAVYQFDGECVLRDVIHIICKHADENALQIIAQVCKSWRCAAVREDKKRYYIRQLRLPGKIGNLRIKFNVTPFVSLFTYEPSLQSLLELKNSTASWHTFPEKCEKELLEHLKKKLPNRIIMFMVENYLTTEDVKFQNTEEQSQVEPIRHRNIQGLFFPIAEKQVDVRLASFNNRDLMFFQIRIAHNNDATIKRLLEELDLNNCGSSKFAILMLAHDTISNDELDIVREIYKSAKQKGNEVTFCSMFGGKLALDRYDSDAYALTICRTTALLRIGGPSVESWCAYIHYCAQRDEIERKIGELKEQVKPNKRHYIGLFYSRHCKWPGCTHAKHPCGNSHEMMSKLKNVFPYVRFVGFFMECYNVYSRSQHPDRSSECELYDDGKSSSFYYYFVDIESV